MRVGRVRVLAGGSDVTSAQVHAVPCPASLLYCLSVRFLPVTVRRPPGATAHTVAPASMRHPVKDAVAPAWARSGTCTTRVGRGSAQDCNSSRFAFVLVD